MSKGSSRRPQVVNELTVHDNWERTFGSAKTHAPKPRLGARGYSDAFYVDGPDPLLYKDPEEIGRAIQEVFGACGVEVIVSDCIPPGTALVTNGRKGYKLVNREER